MEFKFYGARLTPTGPRHSVCDWDKTSGMCMKVFGDNATNSHSKQMISTTLDS